MGSVSSIFWKTHKAEVQKYHRREIFKTWRVAIAVKKMLCRCHWKQRNVLTSRSNNFGVSRKRFKPPTPAGRAGVQCSAVLINTLAMSHFHYCYLIDLKHFSTIICKSSHDTVTEKWKIPQLNTDMMIIIIIIMWDRDDLQQSWPVEQ